MNSATDDFPLLRWREHGVEHRFNHVMTLMGHIVGVDDDVFRLHQGRERVTEILLEDVESLLGGAEMARAILVDAGKNNDLIHLGVAHGRLTYENPKQLERFLAQTGAA